MFRATLSNIYISSEELVWNANDERKVSRQPRVRLMKRSMWHSSAPRILVELLYGQDPEIILVSSHGYVEVSISKLSQRLQMRSGALLENIEWLDSQDLIKSHSVGRRKVQILLKPNRAEGI